MKRLSGVIYLLFVVFMITSPLLICVEAGFAHAQTTAPTFSGELILDPYFAEEPYIEIGASSPEFDYEYTAGSVALIWMHSAGHLPSYGGYYPPICNEYARVYQTLDSDYNESIKSIKISVALKVDCTGDFATQDVLSGMWEVDIRFHHSYGGFIPIKTISDLENGDNEEIEFMMSETEMSAISYGGVISEIVELTLQLNPTYRFSQTIGNITPWMNYSGSVVLTITHISVQLMLDGESLAPALRSPKYNTTLLENETDSVIIGIESAGSDQLYEFRLDSNPEIEYSIFTLFSNHQKIRNRTVYTTDSSLFVTGIFNFAVGGDRIALSAIVIDGTTYNARIQCLDSFGNFFWNTTVNLYYQDIPLLARFDGSGNIIVYMLSLHSPMDPYDPYSQILVYSIVKLDNQGNQIWNTTIKTQTYSEYVNSISSTFSFTTGLGCVGNNLFIGEDHKIIKFDSNGNQVWSKDYSHSGLLVDPQGGFYTNALKHGVRTELSRWDDNGNIVWTKSLGWDYGNGWVEYPIIRSMTVGSNGLLHLVLEYNKIQTCVVLTRITGAGDLLSEDTIFEIETPDINDPYYPYNSGPYISDIAVTGDGLVHMIGRNYYYPYYISQPFVLFPATFLITYELPGLLTFTPISLTLVGVASILIIAIAYDFFFRRGKVPEAPAEPSITDFEW